MPTTRPRYALTDTGKLARALDLAEHRWPGHTRRELVDLLLEAGADHLRDEGVDREQRLVQQRRALRRIPELVDTEVLLSDQAWR